MIRQKDGITRRQDQHGSLQKNTCISPVLMKIRLREILLLWQWEARRVSVHRSDTDYLGLGSDARINTPSTLGGNWEWRMKPGEPDEGTVREMERMSKNHTDGCVLLK